MSTSLRRCFDVQLHQIDQRRSAGDEANVGALLRRLCLGGHRHRAAGIGGRVNSNVFIASLPWPTRRWPTNLLDGGHDVGVGAAAADVAAHQLLHVGIGGAARLLEQRHRRHDLARRAVAALVAVALDKRRLHGMQASGVPRPSIVVISSPSCRRRSVRQEFTRRPLTCTVQAPHWPWSQPFFVPVSATVSRRQSRSVVRGSMRRVRSCR